MSKAVPWSGEVRGKGRPSVTFTASSKSMTLSGANSYTGTTAVNAGQQLPATHSTQREIGLKVEPFRGLLLQGTFFSIKRGSAYTNAANVFVLDGRAKFEGEANEYKASTKSCQAKNVQLIGAGREILKRYHSLTIGDAFVATEPLVGVGRVNAQNFLQDSTDKLLDQKATP